MAGPKRPEGRVALPALAEGFAARWRANTKRRPMRRSVIRSRTAISILGHGDVVIAATHLLHQYFQSERADRRRLARAQRRRQGPHRKTLVKTSLAPGSQVVAEYLANSGLQLDLDKVGFNLIGFGCTTCIGNSARCRKRFRRRSMTTASSAPQCFLEIEISKAASVPTCRPITSPRRRWWLPMRWRDGDQESRGRANRHRQGRQAGVLKDIWPTTKEINALMKKFVTAAIFKKRYADVFKGDTNWRKIKTVESETYRLEHELDLCAEPALLRRHEEGAGWHRPTWLTRRILAMFGDKITTDHISPAGSIKLTSPAGGYLSEHQVRPGDFNQYGTRRGNHE